MRASGRWVGDAWVGVDAAGTDESVIFVVHSHGDNDNERLWLL